MPKSRYRFSRTSLYVPDRNRPSTRAINMLVEWVNAGEGRNFTEVEDGDEYQIADISWLDSDTDATGELQELEDRAGLHHEALG